MAAKSSTSPSKLKPVSNDLHLIRGSIKTSENQKARSFGLIAGPPVPGDVVGFIAYIIQRPKDIQGALGWGNWQPSRPGSKYSENPETLLEDHPSRPQWIYTLNFQENEQLELKVEKFASDSEDAEDLLPIPAIKLPCAPLKETKPEEDKRLRDTVMYVDGILRLVVSYFKHGRPNEAKRLLAQNASLAHVPEAVATKEETNHDRIEDDEIGDIDTDEGEDEEEVEVSVVGTSVGTRQSK